MRIFASACVSSATLFGAYTSLVADQTGLATPAFQRVDSSVRTSRIVTSARHGPGAAVPASEPAVVEAGRGVAGMHVHVLLDAEARA
jgi:hypothetical protein